MSPESGTRRPSELAELLEALKLRSGRSYVALARRTGLSRSTLHRYCQGSTVPTSFGAVESVARACGASAAERDRLYRAWWRATSRDGEGEDGDEAWDGDWDGGRDEPAGTMDVPPRIPPGTPPGTPSNPPSREAGAAIPPTASAPFRRLSRRAYPWLRAVLLLLALAATSVASVAPDRGGGSEVAAAGGAEDGRDVSGGQRVEGPAWSVAPRRVPPEFFGLTMNTDTGEMPEFRTGAVRLWETGTRWGRIERRRGQYDWSVLERTVDAAERQRLPVLFTLGGTPRWAAADKQPSGYPDSLASPPDDLADWDRFVRELATRYRGRIESYELWDYAGDRLSYAGSLGTLAEMTERAARIIHRTDPDARVACPSFGGLWERQGRELLRKFIRTGAYRSCDAVALKLPPRRADGPPEQIIDIARHAHRILYEEGAAHLPLWNTGTDRDVAVAPSLDARRALDYAARFYLAGLYSWDRGVRRMYFYSWGGTRVPLVVEPVGGPPTQAARRMERLRQWLDGARIAACGRGERSGLPRSAYMCRFERHGRTLFVRWTTRGRAAMTLDDGAYRIRRLDGRTARVRAGDRITFGEEPVLVEHRPD